MIGDTKTLATCPDACQTNSFAQFPVSPEHGFEKAARLIVIGFTVDFHDIIGIVGELENFLQYLKRGDVTEIVFQSGATAAAKKKGKLKPVTTEPLSARHILKLVNGTPLQKLVPSEDGASAPTPASLQS